MSVCFLCISRAKPVEKLSRERPLGNIFNFYVLLSVLLQFALHIVTMVYITDLCHALEECASIPYRARLVSNRILCSRGPIDLEAKFEPNLLNTAVFFLGLSQQVSTFALNYQDRPFREGIRENPMVYWGLVGASAVAVSGATVFMPEMNRWLQVIEMSTDVRHFAFNSAGRTLTRHCVVQDQADGEHGHRLRRLVCRRARLQMAVRRSRT